MENTEEIISLSPKERRKLQSSMENVFLVAGGLAGFILLIAIGFVNASGPQGAVIPLIVFSVFGVAARKPIMNHIKDFRSTQKRIVRGKISNKREEIRKSTIEGGKGRTGSCYISVGKDEISVNAKQFNEFYVGQQVELHLSLHTSRLLNIYPLDAAGMQLPPKKAAEPLPGKQKYILAIESADMLEAEKNYLRRISRNKSLGSLIRNSIAVALSLLFATALYQSADSSTKAQVVWMGEAILLTVVGLRFFNKVQPFYKDLKESKKEIVTALVQDTFSTNAKMEKHSRELSNELKFYVQIAGTYIGVSEANFQKVQKGEQLYLHRTLHSAVSLRLENIHGEVLANYAG